MIDFCHLHVHNEHSLLDGFGTSEDYAKRAKEMGQTHLALTNHGNVDGNIKFQQSCEKEGIIPIHGFEGYLVDNMLEKEKKEIRYHITLLAENEIGWKNILQLLTEAWMEGFNKRPRFDVDALLRHSEGLIILSACSSSFLTHPNGEKILLDIKQNVPEGNLWLEVMPHNFKPQLEVNSLCQNYSKKYNLPILATNDCHYVKEEDCKLQEVLLAIQSQAKWKDPNRWKFSFTGLHARSAEEMFNEFQKQGQFSRRETISYLTNTMLVAEKCKFKIPKSEVKLPQVPGFEGRDDSEVIVEICREGFEKKIVNRVKGIRVYENRMKEELETIINLGFSRYFVIVWELVNWCKNNDIMVGPGRGSVGGSLVAYLMGITSVDPIKYGLVFARFISPARIDLPDIDMDFEDAKRHLVRKHLEDIYGKDCVSSVSTFSTMKGRGALRDVSRVFDIPIVDVNAASKSIVQRCLDGDSLVYTVDGPIPIKELIDKKHFIVSSSYGYKKETKEVLEVYKNPCVEMFEIELESGKKVVCSKNHKFWAEYKYPYGGKIKTRIGWRKLKELNPETDKILSCELDEVYFSCKECGKRSYKQRGEYHNRKFCSLSCLTTYRNKTDNPMKNKEISIKNGLKKKESLEKNPDTHPFRVIAKRKREGTWVQSELHQNLVKEIKNVFCDCAVEEEFRIKQKFGKGKYWWIDVAIPSLKLAFEFDGSQHRMKWIKERDDKKDEELKSCGWSVFRFTDSDVGLQSRISRIRKELHEI